MNSNYTGFIQAKNGWMIPVKNNLAFHSKYNPEKEALDFASQFSIQDRFIITGGICGGYHLQKLLESGTRTIIAVENTREDIEFLLQNESLKKLLQNPNLHFCTPESLFKKIISLYLPAFHGQLKVLNLRSWENVFPETIPKIRYVVSEALKSVSSDFSVQARFGKIWHKNILSNLSFADKAVSFNEFKKNIEPVLNQKKAAVIAAGPGLDTAIEELKNNRNEYYIISTDTAFSALSKQGIKSDAVVSIDGQRLSSNHYIQEISPETTLFLDLCTDTSISKKAFRHNLKVVYFESGHPLSVLASMSGCKDNQRNFIHLEAGSGTVTIAALDLAVKAGFMKQEVFGADFSYSEGKTYTKGTYLENLYALNQSRLIPNETIWNKLLFRTELIKTGDNRYTTTVLQSYKKSFDSYIKNIKSTALPEFNQFNFHIFNENYRNLKLSLPEKFQEVSLCPALFMILPLMAFYEKTESLEKSYELARCKVLQYN